MQQKHPGSPRLTHTRHRDPGFTSAKRLGREPWGSQTPQAGNHCLFSWLGLVWEVENTQGRKERSEEGLGGREEDIFLLRHQKELENEDF